MQDLSGIETENSILKNFLSKAIYKAYRLLISVAKNFKKVLTNLEGMEKWLPQFSMIDNRLLFYKSQLPGFLFFDDHLSFYKP